MGDAPRAAAVAADATLSALQPNTPTTGSPASGPACPAATDCFNYSLIVPASNPKVGTFNSGSIAFSGPMLGTVVYSLNAVAPSCTGVTPTSGTVAAIEVTPGGSTAVTTPLAFTGCVAP